MNVTRRVVTSGTVAYWTLPVVWTSNLRLCRPYRAQTNGKVESGVKYVRNNFWPSARFTDDSDLNVSNASFSFR